jgi:1,2-diacylglycerol 3-alpha-glucosyltransferase
MRVALFTDTYLPQKNGVAVAVNQLKHELTKLGHEVYIYTIHITNDDQEQEDHVMRSKAIAMPIGGVDENLLAVPNRLRTLHQLKKDKIDIIHTHTEFPQGFMGRYCAKALKIPHIHTVHTMWADYQHYFFRGRALSPKNIAFAYQRFVYKTTAVIAPSKKAQQFLEKIQVKGLRINNGIDADTFFSQASQLAQEQLRETWQLAEDQKVLLFVGRLAPEKRAKELLELLLPLVVARPDCTVMFIGDGVDAKQMKQQTTELGMQHKVLFVGRVEHDQMANYYALARLYVTISLSEVQPMTLIEALFSGLAIVSRQDVAYEGLVVDKLNGSMHDSDEQVLQAVQELLDNDAQLKQYQQGSLGLAQSFSSQSNAGQTLALYQHALQMGRPESFRKGPLIYDE